MLVVDDDPALLSLMGLFLRSLGVDVLTANSAEAGWKAFRAAPGEFTVAVLDGTMPDGSAEDLATRMLRANARLSVIICSGYPVDMTAVEAAAPGRVMFLEKPFTSDMLTDAVRRMLGAQEESV